MYGPDQNQYPKGVFTDMTRLFAFVFSIVSTALPVLAQTSSLQGTVSDAQGAVVPAAIITATNLDTTASRTAVADDSGVYSLTQMAPGTYKIEARKEGFTVY